ncbi:spermidine synthase [Cellulomonas fimi]|uniref:Fused MFS/spermidine synthase n=1 Tax=Cellulomonas fimi TaxID=1708 RepID=A0A7Y0M051_CELFI|nr:fused MFS/spermidine synthase [Cellulomonas fimi]NMR20623.1 fused MFS/spermidine synthase [Cellulomonas fimi]
MAGRASSSRGARSASHRPPTRARPGTIGTLPDGPVPVATGTVELRRDPDDPNGVTLVLNGVPSSHLDLQDPTRLDFEYMQQMAAVVDRVAPPGEPLRVVHLGAAGCTMARYVQATRPGSHQLAIELDSTLAELVRTWFGLPRSPLLRIRTGDARAELSRLATASADVVIRDVFAGSVTPRHVTTREFTAEVARVLVPGGVYLANCADRPPLDVARSEAATVGAVFREVVAMAEPAQLRGRRYGNVVLVGTERTDLLDAPGLERAVRSLPAPTRLLRSDELRAFVGAAGARRDPPEPDASGPS